jgi:glycosyltransferase involved in cell wall biosynthesis
LIQRPSDGFGPHVNLFESYDRTMRFSIVIPTFNRAEMLGDAIRCALEQNHADREIIIVDDGSADETQSVVREFGKAARYLRQENQGKAAALNLGISASEGDVVTVLDDDDVFPPSTLAKHAAALAANPRAAFSYGRYLRFHGQAPPANGLFEEGAFCTSRRSSPADRQVDGELLYSKSVLGGSPHGADECRSLRRRPCKEPGLRYGAAACAGE